MKKDQCYKIMYVYNNIHKSDIMYENKEKEKQENDAFKIKKR